MTTKTAKTLLAAASTVGANTPVLALEWNLSTAMGGIATVRITNGSSAPTTPPVVQFFIGEATGVKRLFWSASGDTVNNSIIDIPPCEFPAGVMFANITVTGGATNACTAGITAQELTTL